MSVTGDVIESAPPPRRPGLARAAVIVAAVLAVAAVLISRGTHRPTSFDPMPIVTGPATNPVVALPDHIATDALAPGVDLGVFVAPTRPPMLVDTTTRTSQRLPQVRDGGIDSSFDVTDLGDGRSLIVAWLSSNDAEAYLAVDGTATRIAAGDGIVVGADGASVLVSREEGTAGRSIQRYDLAGHEVGGPVPLGPDEYLAAETVDGWVVINDSTNHWQVRDPVTHLVRYQIDEPMAVGPHTLAHALTDGRLAVDTLPGGNAAISTVVYPRLPATGLVYRALFSPDARYLAVDLIGVSPIDHTLLVLDRTTEEWSVLPGTPVRPTDGLPFGMTWGGDVLVVATGAGAVALWHPGDPTVYAAPAAQNSAS